MNLVPTGFGTELSFLFLDIEDFAVDIIGKVAGADSSLNSGHILLNAA